jgi:hypothetical protein
MMQRRAWWWCPYPGPGDAIYTYLWINLIGGRSTRIILLPVRREREKIISTAGNVKHLMVSMFKHSSSLLIQQ